MTKSNKSMKKSKPTQTQQRTKRKPTRLVAGIAVGVVAVIVLVVVLNPKTSDTPGPEVKPQVQSDQMEANYLILKNETIAVARQLIRDFPQDAFPLGLMGTVSNQFGNTAEAETWWRRGLERNPTRADVFDVLALAFLTKGEFQKVVDLSLETLAVAPDAIGVHRRLAEALLELGELDAALTAIEKERENNPDFNEVYIILGRIQLQRKEYQAAMAAYERALELRPGDPRCYFGLSTVTARLGRGELSREYMAKFTVVRAAQDEASTARRRATDVIARPELILAEALVDAGRVYEAHGQIDKAETLWRRGATVDPTNTTCRVQLVKLYRRTRRWPDAAEVCAQLTNIDPKNASFHQMAGIVYVELGQFGTAEQSLRRAVELAPNNVEIQKALVQLQQRM